MPAGPTLPNFLERTRAATKIIVVDFGFLGDSVHLVPALWEIKRHYAGAQLHTLSATVGAELLAMAPCVDRPWAFPLTAKSPPWWKHWDILLGSAPPTVRRRLQFHRLRSQHFHHRVHRRAVDARL
jgi:hypothetical protein